MNHCTKAVDLDAQHKSDQDRYRSHISEVRITGVHITIQDIIAAEQHILIMREQSALAMRAPAVVPSRIYLPRLA